MISFNTVIQYLHRVAHKIKLFAQCVYYWTKYVFNLEAIVLESKFPQFDPTDSIEMNSTIMNLKISYSAG